MRASSAGLEVSVEDLTKEQILNLPGNPLKGILEFRGVLSEDIREIPFELRYDKNQRGFVKVDLSPEEVYFGDAEGIVFCIGENYYNSLLKLKSAEGGRFFGASGKLNLYSR